MGERLRKKMLSGSLTFLIIFSIFSIFSFVQPVAADGVLPADASLIFSENFEGDLSAWENSTTTNAEIYLSNDAAEGSKSLACWIDAPVDSEEHAYFEQDLDENSLYFGTGFAMTFDFKLNVFSGETAYPWTMFSFYSMFQVGFNETDYSSAYLMANYGPAEFDWGSGFSLETWHEVAIVVDLPNNNASMYLDGSPFAYISGYESRSDTLIGNWDLQVEMSTSGTESTEIEVFFDDFKIYSVGVPESVVPSTAVNVFSDDFATFDQWTLNATGASDILTSEESEFYFNATNCLYAYNVLGEVSVAQNTTDFFAASRDTWAEFWFYLDDADVVTDHAGVYLLKNEFLYESAYGESYSAIYVFNVSDNMYFGVDSWGGGTNISDVEADGEWFLLTLHQHLGGAYGEVPDEQFYTDLYVNGELAVHDVWGEAAAFSDYIFYNITSQNLGTISTASEVALAVADFNLYVESDSMFSSVSHSNTGLSSLTTFQTTVYDLGGLVGGGSIFSTNMTDGNWQNETYTPFSSNPETIQTVKTTGSTGGVTVGYTWFVNSTDGEWIQSDVYTFVTDDESYAPPPSNNGLGDDSDPEFTDDELPDETVDPAVDFPESIDAVVDDISEAWDEFVNQVPPWAVWAIIAALFVVLIFGALNSFIKKNGKKFKNPPSRSKKLFD